MKTSFLAAALGAAALISGCATPVTEKQQDPIVDVLTGKPTAWLQSHLGLPNEREEYGKNSMLWVYQDNQRGSMATSCRVSVSIRNNTVERVAIDSERHSLASLAATPCQALRKSVQREALVTR